MKQATRWGLVFALGASGVLAFACGGGNKEPAVPPTASASNTAPQPSASAAPSDTATASATATPTSTAPPTPATPFTVIAMKMTMTGKQSHTVELKADGSVVADGKPSGKITNAELDDAGGQTVAYVTGDNTIKISGQTSSSVAKFNDKDAIEVDGHPVIAVADDGTTTLVGPDGKTAKMKFTGFKPPARRTAAFLVFAMLVPKMATVTTLGTASAVTPAPKK